MRQLPACKLDTYQGERKRERMEEEIRQLRAEVNKQQNLSIEPRTNPVRVSYACRKHGHYDYQCRSQQAPSRHCTAHTQPTPTPVHRANTLRPLAPRSPMAQNNVHRAYALRADAPG